MNNLNEEQKLNGCAYIEQYIMGFDYNSVLEQCAPEKMILILNSICCTFLFYHLHFMLSKD